MIQSIYAHWRLHMMVRAWKKSSKLLTKLSRFLFSSGNEEKREKFDSAMKTIREVMEDAVRDVEDNTIAELKEAYDID